MHNTTWAPHTMLSFRKKLKSQFQDIFLKEVWTDLIHRTPLAMARVRQENKSIESHCCR